MSRLDDDLLYQEIRNIDKALTQLIAHRMVLTLKVGRDQNQFGNEASRQVRDEVEQVLAFAETLEPPLRRPFLKSLLNLLNKEADELQQALQQRLDNNQSPTL